MADILRDHPLEPGGFSERRVIDSADLCGDHCTTSFVTDVMEQPIATTAAGVPCPRDPARRGIHSHA